MPDLNKPIAVQHYESTVPTQAFINEDNEGNPIVQNLQEGLNCRYYVFANFAEFQRFYPTAYFDVLDRIELGE